MKETNQGDKTRNEYWNEKYYEYWKSRVDEANTQKGRSTIIKNDSVTTSDLIYFSAINLLEIQKTDAVLEIGCGFGRSISYISDLCKRVSAIDISEKMIVEAKKNNGTVKNVDFFVSEAENTPFSNESFDKVICFAVFDALNQTQSLLEMNRVLKNNGKLLITGKNDHYSQHDVEAINAEEGARKKQHPNFFTDVNKLVGMLNVSFGFEIVVEKYYPKRGDFTKNIFNSNKPGSFYEYLFVLKKINPGLSISSNISKTFKNLKIKPAQ